MNLAKYLSTGIFVFTMFPGFGQNAFCLENKQTWSSRPIIDILELEISDKSEKLMVLEDYLVDSLIYQGDVENPKSSNKLRELKEIQKSLKDLDLPQTDLRQISLRYKILELLTRQGKYGSLKSLLVRNLKAEIERDFLIESRWRKHLGDKEIEEQKMETKEDFALRKKVDLADTRKNLPGAVCKRLARLYFQGREPEAKRLSKIALNLFERDGFGQEELDLVKFWGAVAKSSGEAIILPEDESLKKIVLAKIQSDPSKALTIIQKNKIDNAKYGDESSVIKLYLDCFKAKLLCKNNQINRAREVLTKLCNSFLARRHGYKDSFAYRPSLNICLNLYIDLTNKQYFPIYDKLNQKRVDNCIEPNVIKASVDAVFKNIPGNSGSDKVISSGTKNDTVVKVDPSEINKLKLIAFDFYFIGYKFKVVEQKEKAQFYIGLATEVFKRNFKNSPKLYDGCLYDLGEVYSWSKNYGVASVFLADCLDIRENSGRSKDAIVMTMSLLGRSLLSAGEIEKGRIVLASALAYRLEEALPKTKNGNESFSKSAFLKSDLKNKISQIESVYIKADSQLKEKIRISMQNWIDSFIASRHYGQARSVGEVLLDYKAKTESAKLSSNLWQLAFIASGASKMDLSRELYTRLFRDYGDEDERARAHWYYARGLAQDALGNYKEATKDFVQAKKLFSSHIKTIDQFEDFEDYEYIYWLIDDLKNEIAVRRKNSPGRTSYIKAYKLYKWPAKKMPLKVCIDKTIDRGFGPNLLKQVEGGIKQWSDISNDCIQFQFVDSKDRCDIYVERVSNYDFIPPGSAGRAEAELILSEEKRPSQLNKVHLRIYSKTRNGDELSNHALRQIKTLSAHEFGHALGLGHSPNGKDIMYWKASGVEISKRDRRTLLELYGCKE